MFAVEKNVPVPPPQSKYGSKYPFKTMEIGDSFKTKNTKGGGTYAACKKDSKETGRKYTQIKEADGFYRVWRIS